MQIIDIDINDLSLLEKFIAGLGRSAETFRYFRNRPPQAIAAHICTRLLLDDDGEPIGYGHLDPADGRVWLGIALVERAAGHGHGKILMASLLEEAERQGLAEIHLAVDNVNVRARALYEKSGFKLIEDRGNLSVYRMGF